MTLAVRLFVTMRKGAAVFIALFVAAGAAHGNS